MNDGTSKFLADCLLADSEISLATAFGFSPQLYSTQARSSEPTSKTLNVSLLEEKMNLLEASLAPNVTSKESLSLLCNLTSICFAARTVLSEIEVALRLERAGGRSPRQSTESDFITVYSEVLATERLLLECWQGLALQTTSQANAPRGDWGSKAEMLWGAAIHSVKSLNSFLVVLRCESGGAVEGQNQSGLQSIEENILVLNTLLKRASSLSPKDISENICASLGLSA